MADDQNITLGQFKSFMEKADQRLDALELGKRDITALMPITIPTTGWGADSTYPPYSMYYDIAIDGLLDTDIVVVETLPGYEEAAREANFMQTQSYAGKVRLRAEKAPTAAISAQYRIISTVRRTAQ